MLGRQPTPKNVVGVGHHFHCHTLQIAVQVAGRQEDALPALEADPIQQQRGQHTRVSGIAFAEFQNGAGLSGEFLCTGTDIGDSTFENSWNQ